MHHNRTPLPNQRLQQSCPVDLRPNTAIIIIETLFRRREVQERRDRRLFIRGRAVVGEEAVEMEDVMAGEGD